MGVTSLNTKKMLSSSLKKFMLKKPLSKITVSEIVADCGINRKTFYYHFEDISDLLKWTLEQEAFDIVKKFDLIHDTEEVISFVLTYVEENKHILQCIHDSVGRDEVKRFFRKDIYAVVLRLIQETEKLHQIQPVKDYEIFLCDFYTNAISGQIVELFYTHEPYDKKKFTRYLVTTLKATLISALEENGKNFSQT